MDKNDDNNVLDYNYYRCEYYNNCDYQDSFLSGSFAEQKKDQFPPLF